MAAPPIMKRRHLSEKRLGERRREKDAGSSRDASEEDNEEELSDVGSLASAHNVNRHNPSALVHPPSQSTHSGGSVAPGISAAHRRALGQKKLADTHDVDAEGSHSDGIDSPVYDGDVESSSTIGGTPIHPTFPSGSIPTHARRPSSPTPGQSGYTESLATTPPAVNSSLPMNRLPTPKASKSHLRDDSSDFAHPTIGKTMGPPKDVPVAPSIALSPASKSQLHPLSAKPSSASIGPMRMTSRPKELSVEDIRGFVQRSIEGKGEEDGVERWWKTREPPKGRPIRIYADGVYDLFHFGHALQLRQAKLSFPNVYLLVGVCSDELCEDHKSAPSMTHAERCEAVRHCRWVDEVLPDAPWIVDQEWMDKYDIDYLAHDEVVYPSKGVEDVYAFAKQQGSFLPTRRTPCISTSDLLERIVRGYRDGFFDSKLEKNGLPELLAADVDWDSSASVERRERRKKKNAVLKAVSQIQPVENQ